MREFLIARNRDPLSKLPYLLHLPIEGGLWLKVKETWPRGARVYCHRLDSPPHIQEDDVVERVPVTLCQRRGPAIDLILARGNNKRSQFIATTFRGRPMIFWQTPKSAASSRPGLRVPFARPVHDATFLIDTRERYGYAFKTHGALLVRRVLPAGDYAVECGGRIAAVVERKTAGDFVASLVNGSINFAMAELAAQPLAAVVVEAMYSTLLRHEYTRAGFVADVIARLQARYPSVPIVFAESRKVAEEWTFRFLRAAHGNDAALPLSALPQSALTPQKTARKPRHKRDDTQA